MLFTEDEEFGVFAMGTTIETATNIIKILDENSPVKVLNVETSPWYGGATEATLKLEEAVKVMRVSKDTNELKEDSRILIDIYPRLWWMDSDLTQLLIDHGQSHTEFRPIQTFGILQYSSNSSLQPICIPLNREQIILDASFSLVEKLLMIKPLIQTKRDEFRHADLTPSIRDIVLYSVCQCATAGAANEAIENDVNHF